MRWRPHRLTVRLGGAELPAHVCASCDGDGFLTPGPSFALIDGNLTVRLAYSPLLQPCLVCLGLGLVAT